jgi:hypothetical protein
MGLAVEVGMLADLLVHDEEGAEWLRRSFAAINAVLKENGLPEHREPETMPPLDNRAGLASFPYSYLHHLRRAYAHWHANPGRPIKPCLPGEDPIRDPLLLDLQARFMSHLLCHSDAEGFYIPIDFADVVVGSDERIAGGLVGSSYQLMRELVGGAPALGIDLQARELTDAEAERLNAQADGGEGLWMERAVWLTLYEAARLSITHRSAICFT